MTALAALTERMMLGQVRDDLPFAILAPAGNFVVFNLALGGVRRVVSAVATSSPVIAYYGEPGRKQFCQRGAGFP